MFLQQVDLGIAVVHELDRTFFEDIFPLLEFLIFSFEGPLKGLHACVFEEELLDVVWVFYPEAELIVIYLSRPVIIDVLEDLHGVILDSHDRRRRKSCHLTQSDDRTLHEHWEFFAVQITVSR